MAQTPTSATTEAKPKMVEAVKHIFSLSGVFNSVELDQKTKRPLQETIKTDHQANAEIWGCDLTSIKEIILNEQLFEDPKRWGWIEHYKPEDWYTSGPSSSLLANHATPFLIVIEPKATSQTRYATLNLKIKYDDVSADRMMVLVKGLQELTDRKVKPNEFSLIFPLATERNRTFLCTSTGEIIEKAD